MHSFLAVQQHPTEIQLYASISHNAGSCRFAFLLTYVTLPHIMTPAMIAGHCLYLAKKTTMDDFYRVLNDNTRGGGHIDGFGVKKIPTQTQNISLVSLLGATQR
jgi:hypothetical protein